MAYTISIGITDVTALVRIDPFEIDDPTNERSTANFDVFSLDASYRPAVGAAVIIMDGAVCAFGGNILSTSERDIGDGVGIVTAVECVGYDELASRVLVTMSWASTNLFTVLTYLVAQLVAAGYAVILHASQENPGPTLEQIDWNRKKLSECLTDLTSATGYMRRINSSKALRMWAPGATGMDAPFTISDGDPNCISLVVKRTREDYFNRLIVKYTEAEVTAWAFLKTTGNFSDAEEVEVGGHTYVFQDTLTNVAGHVHIGTDAEDSLNHLAAAIVLGAGAGTDYAATTTENSSVEGYWQAADMMTARALNPGASGNSIACTTTAANATWIWEGSIPLVTLAGGADSALTGSVTVNDLPEQVSYGLYENIVEAPLATTYAQALVVATTLLAQNDPFREVLTIVTRDAGLISGYKLNVIYTKRDVSDYYLITDVHAVLDPDLTFRYTVEAEGGNVFRGSYLDTYREWSGSGSSVVSISGTGGGPGVTTVFLHAHLGGSRTVPVTYADWWPIEDFQTFKAPLSGAYRFRVESKTDNAGTTVQVRLYDVTASAAVAGSTTTATASLTWVEEELAVTLIANHKYRAEQKGSNTSAGTLVGQATVEV